MNFIKSSHYKSVEFFCPAVYFHQKIWHKENSSISVCHVASDQSCICFNKSHQCRKNGSMSLFGGGGCWAYYVKDKLHPTVNKGKKLQVSKNTVLPNISQYFQKYSLKTSSAKSSATLTKNPVQAKLEFPQVVVRSSCSLADNPAV